MCTECLHDYDFLCMFVIVCIHHCLTFSSYFGLFLSVFSIHLKKDPSFLSFHPQRNQMELHKVPDQSSWCAHLSLQPSNQPQQHGVSDRRRTQEVRLDRVAALLYLLLKLVLFLFFIVLFLFFFFRLLFLCECRSRPRWDDRTLFIILDCAFSYSTNT